MVPVLAVIPGPPGNREAKVIKKNIHMVQILKGSALVYVANRKHIGSKQIEPVISHFES
jgi:hypothetical protein